MIGFLAAFTLPWLNSNLGTGKVYAIGEGLLAAGAISLPALPKTGVQPLLLMAMLGLNDATHDTNVYLLTERFTKGHGRVRGFYLGMMGSTASFAQIAVAGLSGSMIANVFGSDIGAFIGSVGFIVFGLNTICLLVFCCSG